VGRVRPAVKARDERIRVSHKSGGKARLDANAQGGGSGIASDIATATAVAPPTAARYAGCDYGHG